MNNDITDEESQHWSYAISLEGITTDKKYPPGEFVFRNIGGRVWTSASGKRLHGTTPIRIIIGEDVCIEEHFLTLICASLCYGIKNLHICKLNPDTGAYEPISQEALDRDYPAAYDNNVKHGG